MLVSKKPFCLVDTAVLLLGVVDAMGGFEWNGVGCFGLEVVWGGGGVDGRIDWR